MLGMTDGGDAGYGARLDETVQMLLQRERSALSGDGDFLVEVLERVLPDVLTCAIAHHQQFAGRDAPSVDRRHEPLRHYGSQGIPHLAEDENIWSLPHRLTQRVGEAAAVDADLYLLDDTLAMPMFVFDRILNR
jgi:hypothetical protein